MDYGRSAFCCIPFLVSFNGCIKYTIMTQHLSRLVSSLLVIVLCGVITAAFGYQLMVGQNPCPLCFLQRVGMIGVAMGQVLNFRFGVRLYHNAISIFFCIFGAAVALRHICLHICPGSTPFGVPVLGFGLYTWSFIVFVCSLIAIGLLMLLYDPKWKVQHSKPLDYLERFASLYLFLIVVADVITAAAVCGWVCPDNP
jgi:disulfide bond formation protein DsbB